MSFQNFTSMDRPYNYFFLIVILMILVIEIDGKKCCNSSISKTNKDLCQFQQSEGPARHCLDLEILVKTDEDKQALLDKINNRRNKIAAGELKSYPAAANMLKLDWSSELERSAQRWANQCVQNNSPDMKDACRDLEGQIVGQNIASVYGESPGLQITALVDVWYMELLSNNASILTRFRESNESGPQYEYFTQLVWADSNTVGCGGVKFKEHLQEMSSGKNRTVYRLVCNFAPSGNRENQSVYTQGGPCSKCPEGTICDTVYKSLCSKPASKLQKSQKKSATLSDLEQEFLSKENITITKNKSTFTADESDNYTLFDYLSHLNDFPRQVITATTTPKTGCKDIVAVDNFIDLLKKRLSTDHIFKDLLATKSTPGIPDTNFTDAHVAAFVKRVYSKKMPSTTSKTTESELLNSTLLVDLVEAVIFRSGDKPATIQLEESTSYPVSAVHPVKIQAEFGSLQENEDFTGHYFFPEEEDVMNNTDATEAYYDSPIPSVADILHEIEDLKKKTVTRNFLDEILESESSEPSTQTTTTALMPSLYLNVHKPGHEVMKKFLEDIKEKSETSFV